MALTADESKKIDNILSYCERAALAVEDVLSEIQESGGQGADISAAVANHNNAPDAHANFREYKGATASTPGTSGLVPAAAAGDESKVLTGGGAWAEVATPAELSVVQDAAAQALAKAENAGGGAAVISLTEDKAMTATDPRNLLVTADMPGRSIVLPDAAALEADGIAFRIAVDGDYDVTVKDAQGRPVGANSGKVAVGGTRMFLLMDKASGLWRWADWQNGESGGSGAGSTVVPGVGYVFSSSSTAKISAAVLSSDKAIVAYRDSGNSSNYGTAVILTVSGTTINVGGKAVFSSSSTAEISAAVLSSDKAIVAYRDSGNSSNYGTAVILTVSGTTINVGGKAVFNKSRTAKISAAVLSSDKAIVAYQDSGNSNYGTAVILTVSGTTINVGGKAVFSSSSTAEISAAVLSSGKAIVAYQDSGNSNYGTAVILTVSGTTINVGGRAVFSRSSTAEISAAVLSSDKAIVAYQDSGNSSNYGTAVILTVSGTTINVGGKAVFSSSSTYQISAAVLSSDKAIVAYQDSGNSNYGTAVILTVSGTTINVGGRAVFSRSRTYQISAAVLSSDKAIVAYQDAGNSNYGTAQVLSLV